MHDQREKVDGEPGHTAGLQDATGAADTGRGSDLALTPLFEPSATGKETMSTTELSEEAPAASLVGSLSVFSLSDVLALLATTTQTGELQVVSDTVDGKLWLEGGQFSNAHVNTASTIGQAVFELACEDNGWFYFTAGLSSSSGQPLVPVAAVLDEVRHQVDEWRNLRQLVPLEAVVALSPAPPGQDVQIRSEQWNVLTTVGNAGHSVRTVVDLIGGDQIAGLRTLRDLQSAGLIVLHDAPTDQPISEVRGPFELAHDEVAPPTSVPSPPAGYGEESADELAPPPPPGLDPAVSGTDDRFSSLAEVAIMPPPIAGDPWTTTTDPTASVNGNGSLNGNSSGSGDHGAA